MHLRLASLISVISVPCLARRNRGVVNELQQVLAVASNDGQLLAVLAESIELVGESRLQLLASDVGELSFSDKRLSLSADKLLLENDDLG